MKTRYPYIIDLEASGLASNSYPIEVGLALAPGNRFCSLIKPVDEWEHWDQQAESVHGISRDILLKMGRPVTEIAADLGVGHLSRFAHDYKRVYGETPSATLKRHRGTGVELTPTRMPEAASIGA